MSWTTEDLSVPELSERWHRAETGSVTADRLWSLQKRPRLHVKKKEEPLLVCVRPQILPEPLWRVA